MNKIEEECWETGNYSDLCICEMCPHKDECSGYDKEDEEDEEDE